MATNLELTVGSDAAMRALGANVGRALGAISGPVVIELIGDVGAGKTTFVKGLATGLGVNEDIASPSFTISRVYDLPQKSGEGGVPDTAPRQLHHYDFYRLTDAGILNEELGEVTADPQAIVVIEWADIVTGVLPEDHMRLTIRATGLATRRVIAYGLPDGFDAASITGDGRNSDRVDNEHMNGEEKR